jgi:hypothetical protein
VIISLYLMVQVSLCFGCLYNFRTLLFVHSSPTISTTTTRQSFSQIFTTQFCCRQLSHTLLAFTSTEEQFSSVNFISTSRYVCFLFRMNSYAMRNTHELLRFSIIIRIKCNFRFYPLKKIFNLVADETKKYSNWVCIFLIYVSPFSKMTAQLKH